MDLRRPIQILCLALVSAPGLHELNASPTDVTSPHRMTAPARMVSVSRPEVDGDSLEMTANTMTGIFFSPGPLGVYLGKAYVSKVRDAARYPIACEDQLQSLLMHDALSLPIIDGQGRVLAEFNENDRLEVRDKKGFEAGNLCRRGKNETSPQSLLTANGFVTIIDEMLKVENPQFDDLADKAFFAYAGSDIMEKAASMPGCRQDLVEAVNDEADIYRQKDQRTPAELNEARQRVIKGLAEKAFVQNGECRIRYNAGTQPAP